MTFAAAEVIWSGGTGTGGGGNTARNWFVTSALVNSRDQSASSSTRPLPGLRKELFSPELLPRKNEPLSPTTAVLERSSVPEPSAPPSGPRNHFTSPAVRASSHVTAK